jgi:uncharacterized protein
VLIFTSEPLDTDLDVTGLVELTVWVASDAPTADWTARLCEVDSTGRSTGLVDGIYRQPVCSKTPFEIVVRLGHISHLFAKGNRIRLQVASSNFPALRSKTLNLKFRPCWLGQVNSSQPNRRS